MISAINVRVETWKIKMLTRTKSIYRRRYIPNDFMQNTDNNNDDDINNNNNIAWRPAQKIVWLGEKRMAKSRQGWEGRRKN